MREQQLKEKRSVRYEGIWRDRDPAEAPQGVAPTIRLKAPQSGDTVIRDHVQAEVTVANAQLDDLIILRADGTPTSTLGRRRRSTTWASPTSSARRPPDQRLPPDPDLPCARLAGARVRPCPADPRRRRRQIVEAARRARHRRLSRHGLPAEALRNYCCGSAGGTATTRSSRTEQAIQWFDIDAVGRAPARFDFVKLDSLNGHYIRANAGPAAGRADPAAPRDAARPSDRRGGAGPPARRHAGPQDARQDARRARRECPVLRREAGARRQGAVGPRGGAPAHRRDRRELSAPEALATEWSAARSRSGCGSWPKTAASNSALSPNRCAPRSPARWCRRPCSR